MGYLGWKLQNKWYRRFPPAAPARAPIPLELVHVGNVEECRDWLKNSAATFAAHAQFERSLLQAKDRFTAQGSCQLCMRPVDFLIDYQHGSVVNGQRLPNWRECCVCVVCGMNNRTRAAMHMFRQLAQPASSAAIYVTEAVTAQFRWLQSRFPNAVGSEYFGPDHVGGSSVNGVRHEDLTRLSLPDNSFDAVLSFDVLEHIPDYHAALKECLRVLKPGGLMLFSVPFLIENHQTLVRARLLDDGSIEHILPPEYHGDPLKRSDGCLAFYHFGWDLVEELKAIGFAEAGGYFYWSSEFFYLGERQLMLYARKAG